MQQNTGWGSPVEEEPEIGSPAWIKRRDDKLAAWEASKVTLENAKADEMRLRKEFVDYSFDPNKKEGTERIELHNGYEAKAVKKISYNFKSNVEGVDTVDAVDAALNEIEKLDPQGAFVANRLVKWSASLSLSEYRDLDPKYKAIIDKVIETKEGAPTLEIVAPKGSKIK